MGTDPQTHKPTHRPTTFAPLRLLSEPKSIILAELGEIINVCPRLYIYAFPESCSENIWIFYCVYRKCVSFSFIFHAFVWVFIWELDCLDCETHIPQTSSSTFDYKMFADLSWDHHKKALPNRLKLFRKDKKDIKKTSFWDGVIKCVSSITFLFSAFQ